MVKCGHSRSTNVSSNEVVFTMSNVLVMDTRNVGEDCDRYSGAVQLYTEHMIQH